VQTNVAFTAGILGETSGQHTYTGTVKFPTVIYQVGGGYNPTTGVFTAPKAGLYLIFCTNVAYNDEYFWTRIMINGSVKAGVMGFIGSSSMIVNQSASNLVVHQLQVETSLDRGATGKSSVLIKSRDNIFCSHDQWIRLKPQYIKGPCLE
ncbi:uncharacterized protein LOC134248444, partial [Saccostrea cucullata]|uniref:uncharacterized protein LOC134248444 n=1 Tax=Saccostrea cuccullata TaxID=36930 RepID=UPI002ED5050D